MLFSSTYICVEGYKLTSRRRPTMRMHLIVSWHLPFPTQIQRQPGRCTTGDAEGNEETEG